MIKCNPDLINWDSDDGVHFDMLADQERNKFYDEMLAQEAKGKICEDIGFGTGFLSLLALKHGAKEIIAYEQDRERYLLGKQIIDQLGLNDKITLFNKKKSNETTPSKKIDLSFHEIIGSKIWDEGLATVLPLENRVIPETVRCSICVIDHSQIHKILIEELRDMHHKTPPVYNLAKYLGPRYDYSDILNNMISKQQNFKSSLKEVCLRNLKNNNKKLFDQSKIIRTIDVDCNQMSYTVLEHTAHDEPKLVKNKTFNTRPDYCEFDLDINEFDTDTPVLLHLYSIHNKNNFLPVISGGWHNRQAGICITDKIKLKKNTNNGKFFGKWDLMTGNIRYSSTPII